MISKKPIGLGLFAVVVAMLAMAFTAAPAFAGKASESLPSTEEAKWTGVDVTCPPSSAPCTFKAVSQHSWLTQEGVKLADCVVTLEGTVDENGDSTFSKVTIAEGEEVCKQIIATHIEQWTDEICQYTGEPIQFWDQIKVHFTYKGTEIAGNLYAHLEGEGTDPLTITTASVNGYIDNGPFDIHAFGNGGTGETEKYHFVNPPPPIVVESNTEKPCSWDFENLDA